MNSIALIMKERFQSKKARGRGQGDDAQRKRELDLSEEGSVLFCELVGDDMLSTIRERRTFMRTGDD